MYGGMAAGHLALQLAADDPRPLGMRLWSDAMVLALVVVVGFIFEEFARAARRSYHMRNELERTVGALETSRARISETAAGVASSAKQLEQSAAELLGRASASDADGEAVARESKRLAEAARALQARSRESAATASDAQKRAVAVAALIEDIEAGVADVSAAVVTAEAAFGELRARAEDIGSFAETAKDLASQTQMVSINAGIEASAAGANGKGFAVIAREVSKLSQESRAGAQAVALIVEELQRRMGALLGSLEQVRSRTGHFTSTFGNARASLEQINGIVDALGAAMQANARDADAQAEATAAVSWSTSRMTDGLRAQAAVSAGVAGTSSALAQHAAGLRSLLPVDPRKEAAEAATVRPPPAPAK
jgi:methyl-accepting chemotaxis protein